MVRVSANSGRKGRLVPDPLFQKKTTTTKTKTKTNKKQVSNLELQIKTTRAKTQRKRCFEKDLVVEKFTCYPEKIGLKTQNSED